MMSLLIDIDVPALEPGVRFYTNAFGLSVGRRFADDFVELLGWPVPLYLLVKAPGTRAAGADLRRYGRHWTPLHLDVVVEDIDATVARAVGAGAVVEMPAKDEPYGRIAMLGDPFGHGFCLIQFRDKGYDALL